MSKVVIVTGASRGIGAATAILLGTKGYAVCVNYLANKERANEVVDSLVCNGGQAFAYQADVSNEADVISLFDAAEERFGSVTHLVNNAGILFSQSKLIDIDLERPCKYFCVTAKVKRSPPSGLRTQS